MITARAIRDDSFLGDCATISLFVTGLRAAAGHRAVKISSSMVSISVKHKRHGTTHADYGYGDGSDWLRQRSVKSDSCSSRKLVNTNASTALRIRSQRLRRLFTLASTA